MGGDRFTVEFDHHDTAWLDERRARNAALRAASPVVWNPGYGGYWFVSGYQEVAEVARDSATFTPRFDEGDDGLPCIGIMGIPRPAHVPAAGIAEADGARHAALRRLLNPFMLPSAVAGYLPFVRQAASWFLDQRIADGQMDAVLDFTNPVPAVLTMQMVGLPCEAWQRYGDVFHATVAYGPGDPELQRAVAQVPEMIAELLAMAERRRLEPADDILSALVALEVGGERLADQDVVAVLWNLIGGGLDTTTSLTSLALHHLAGAPDLRRRLRDHPELLATACEEYLRWTTVNETLTRTCTRDTELGGQLIRRGEFVMVSWLGADLDPAVFDRPDEVAVDRAPNPHLAFGLGAHRCIGMHVARTLFSVMLEEVLSRVPDYQVDHGATQFYQGNPELAGVVRMPITFTPGQPRGTPRPF